ncbi:MAG: EF-P lysine aminoacylase GenX [Hyphomicrobiaceae bacterium]|nr:EF-P lysine aminoacylase GenX [Hyphomicrobiaceae bacterium]
MPKFQETTPWWSADRHLDRQPLLHLRARMKRLIRALFEAQGFIEVDTACLQVSPGNETHLHAFRTEAIGPDLSRRSYYLHTSPEFACKKLLAAGERKIFTFAPVFRNRERGKLHHPEFMMLEWYRAGASYEAVMADCDEILSIAARAANTEHFLHRGRRCAAFADVERITVEDAIRQHTGIDILSTVSDAGTNRAALAEAALAAGHNVASDETWSDIFSRLIVEIEPNLGDRVPTFLTEYPAAEAALAQLKKSDPRVAERFELFVCGVELANGFGELNEGSRQRQRLQRQMDEKEKRYGERYPIDEDFIAALDRMPVAAGCALGFDRLVMLAAGAERIEDVIWTPLSE